MTRTRRTLDWALIALSTVAFLALLAPIIVVVAVSFTDSTVVDFPPTGFTLDWYEELVNFGGQWAAAFRLSAVVATLSALISVVLGLLLAIGVTRGNMPLKGAVTGLVLAPLVVPHVVTALSLYFVAARLRVVGETLVLVLGHVILALPIAVLILTTTLAGVDARLDDAARVMGATRRQTVQHVVVPLALPGVVAATIFSFLTSFDEFFIALFLTDPVNKTLPLLIFESLQYSITPIVTVVSSVVILVAVVLLAVSELIQRVVRHRGTAGEAGPAARIVRFEES